MSLKIHFASDGGNRTFVMLELEEALERILCALPNPVNETLDLNAAHRRVLAEDHSLNH